MLYVELGQIVMYLKVLLTTKVLTAVALHARIPVQMEQSFTITKNNHKHFHFNGHVGYTSYTNYSNYSNYSQKRGYSTVPDRSQSKNVYCANCGVEGHIYKHCDQPITSFGILAYKLVDNDQSTTYRNQELQDLVESIPNTQPLEITMPWKRRFVLKDERKLLVQFLLVQRKDTMSFVSFLRGKYDDEEPAKTDLLTVYFSEMTPCERQKLGTQEFKELWDNNWVNHESRYYHEEHERAKKKFESVDIAKMLNMTRSKYAFQEFGIPKGRRNMKESNLDCAKREFEEETGYAQDSYTILNYKPFSEEYTGTNNVNYRHVYYIAVMKEDIKVPVVDENNTSQIGEIKQVGFFTYQECMSLFRDYDRVKREVITQVYEDIVRAYLG